MSQVLSGDLRPVTSVAQNRTGKRPSPATVWRWLRKGVCSGNVKLEAVFHGGQWLTSADAFDQFLQAQTEYALRSRESHSPGIDDSDAALIAAGLL